MFLFLCSLLSIPHIPLNHNQPDRQTENESHSFTQGTVTSLRSTCTFLESSTVFVESSFLGIQQTARKRDRERGVRPDRRVLNILSILLYLYLLQLLSYRLLSFRFFTSRSLFWSGVSLTGILSYTTDPVLSSTYTTIEWNSYANAGSKCYRLLLISPHTTTVLGYSDDLLKLRNILASTTTPEMNRSHKLIPLIAITVDGLLLIARFCS